MTDQLPHGHNEDPYIRPWFACPMCGRNIEFNDRFRIFDRAPCPGCENTVAVPEVLKLQVLENVAFRAYTERANDEFIKRKNLKVNPNPPARGLGGYSSLLGGATINGVRDI